MCARAMSLESVRDYQALGNEHNPLENSAILKQFFEKCSFNDLKNVRLVCRLWYRISLPGWRKNAVVLLDCSTNGRSAVSQFSRMNGSRQNNVVFIEEFLELIANPTYLYNSMPFRSFCLSEVEFSNEKSDVNMSKFWNVCGPHMTQLIIEPFVVRDLNSFRKVIFDKTTNLTCLYLKSCKLLQTALGSLARHKNAKNRVKYETLGVQSSLKSFKIEVCYNVDTNCVTLPFTWEEIFIRFSNLETFKFRMKQFYMDETEPFAILRTLKKLNAKKKLTLIRLQFAFGMKTQQPGDFYQHLIDTKLPLQALNINFGISARSNDSHLRKVVMAFADTLQVLAIRHLRNDQHHLVFPFGIAMNSIQTLHIADSLCPSLEFMKYFPNMSSLAVYKTKTQNRTGLLVCNDQNMELDGESVWSDTTVTGMTDVRMDLIKTLRLEFEFSTQQMEYLTKWMPNVNKLSIPLRNDTFRVVCKNWTRLTELVVLGDQIDDDGVTGIMKVTRRNVLRKPNITDLKDLRSFKVPVEYVSIRKAVFLTEKSILQGFLKTSLRKLEVSVKIKEGLVRKLYSHIPYCQLRRQMGKDEVRKFLAPRKSTGCPPPPFWRTVRNFNFRHQRADMFEESSDDEYY